MAVAAIVLLAGCAQFPTRPSAGPLTDIAVDVAPPSASSLSTPFASAAARKEIAQRLWQLIADRFHDPNLNGVDWPAQRAQLIPRAAAARSDAEFYDVLKAMAASLRDSHTRVLTARESVDRRRFVALRLGFDMAPIEGRIAVTAVDDGSAAAAAGIQRGDVVRSLNGTALNDDFLLQAQRDPATLEADATAGDAPAVLPATAPDAQRVRVQRALQRLLRQALRPDADVELQIERDGAVDRIRLQPVVSVRPPTAQLRRLDSGIALLRVNRFLPETEPQLAAALHAAAEARALVIDLRGNSGGQLANLRGFIGRFMPFERTVLRSIGRDGARATTQLSTELRAGAGAAQPLLQPLAVLIDSRTASAAELAVVTLAEQRAAVLVGEPTCGCVVAVHAEYVLPDGGGLRLAEGSFVSAQGARMEGQPTLPQQRVVPTLADLRAGRDPVLDQALRILRQRLGQ